MTPFWATTGVNLAGIYLLIGLALGPLLVFGAARRFDPAVAGSTLGFRLIILPGAALLWPLLLLRALRGPGPPPLERNAHRDAAARTSADVTAADDSTGSTHP